MVFHVFEGVRQHRNDFVRLFIGKILEKLGESYERMPVGEPSDLCKSQRPDVAHFKNKFRAGPFFQPVTVEDRKRGGRGDDHRIGPSKTLFSEEKHLCDKGECVDYAPETLRFAVSRSLYPAVIDTVYIFGGRKAFDFRQF